MKAFNPGRQELLAGYRGAFESDFINKAVADGDLDKALYFVREAVRREPVSKLEIKEHELAIEFLEEFDGFDDVVASVTDNTYPELFIPESSLEELLLA